MARFLVTGGAGYVGSHIVQALREQGSDVVVLDDLRQGHRAAVPADVPFVEADLTNRALVAEVFANWTFDGVLHLAAISLISDSMREPVRYLTENLTTTLWLAEEAVKVGCMRFVLSSTASLFGYPKVLPIDEDAPHDPVSPYGESKLMSENGLAWLDRTQGLKFAALRYFNAAGADPQGRLGEDHEPESHLIPLAINATLGLGPPLTIFGTDYPTPDGTCIRDYVHVTDLADAHLRVLRQLDGGQSLRYNVGNGTGYSVREVIDMVERVSGRKVPFLLGPPRPGDPPALVASSRKLMEETGWRPQYSDLETMIRHAWAWREANPRGFKGQAEILPLKSAG